MPLWVLKEVLCMLKLIEEIDFSENKNIITSEICKSIISDTYFITISLDCIFKTDNNRNYVLLYLYYNTDNYFLFNTGRRHTLYA
jgi:hypothetical protein